MVMEMVRGIWEFFVLAVPFFYKPKTALQMKLTTTIVIIMDEPS